MIYESRTFWSAVIGSVVTVVTAGLLVAIPDLAEYEKELFAILEIALIGALVRFGVPGAIGEITATWKATKE